MTALSRWVLFLGLGLIVLAGVLYVLGRLNVPLGQLPGDIRIQRGNVSCFIPIVTSLILSGILTLLLNVIIRTLRK